MFGPTTQQVDRHRVAPRGGSPIPVSTDRRSRCIRTLAVAQRALGVSLERTAQPDRREAFFAREAPLVPSSIRELDLRGSRSERRRRRTPQARCGSARPGRERDGFPTPTVSRRARRPPAKPASFYTPDQVGSLYGVGGLITAGQSGTGSRIALGRARRGLRHRHDRVRNLLRAAQRYRDHEGRRRRGQRRQWALEANIDVEEAATQSPHAAITSYEGPNTGQGEFDLYQKIVDARHRRGRLDELGLVEADSDSTLMNVLHSEFVQAAARGHRRRRDRRQRLRTLLRGRGADAGDRLAGQRPARHRGGRNVLVGRRRRAGLEQLSGRAEPGAVRERHGQQRRRGRRRTLELLHPAASATPVGARHVWAGVVSPDSGRLHECGHRRGVPLRWRAPGRRDEHRVTQDRRDHRRRRHRLCRAGRRSRAEAPDASTAGVPEPC